MTDWLSFDAPPSEPLPQRPLIPTTYLSQGSSTRVVPLPTGLARWHFALSELEGTLSTWSLPTTLARRWLAAAQGLMDEHDELEMYVELDPVEHLISVELWNDRGTRVYGIDDYLAYT